ncbi:MAG: hypothetical protein IIB57_05825, partial [Planctomycetes bacterium]|nr:hypothetical protein [Planctomycetota bacterium]
VYVGIVVTFESVLGLFQPEAQSTLIITTMDEDGTAHDRVVARLESNGQLYVARNHWPRAWYSRALEHPNVRVTMDGRTGDYLAVKLEHGRYSALASFLASLSHEVVHYQRWIRMGGTSERGVTAKAFRMVNRYLATVDEP